MKKFQVFFLLACMCLAFGTVNAATSHTSGQPLWYMGKSFSNYAPAKRLTPVSVRVNVLSLLGVPINVCSLVGQTLIGSTFYYKDGSSVLPAPVQCYNYEQVPAILQVAEGDLVVAWGTVLSTGIQTAANKTVTAADISAGVVTVNLLL
ncbi:hypothetical protein SAMN05444266_104103 [Chitinophaga jiangningensis]|uniref:Uncharacterized protein n=1 Tax=Chitinophaga jiangningensis TaxID=1419482 RepID=A0A1M7BWD1_9BACT|nr:hypothetical protein [Chitinophaga jiangningensis]SHL59291.1 hypothetical protein SAMN05444266_104103 [Chitinophaga jiangningensis]